MSDLSVKTVPEGAVSPPRKAVPSEVKAPSDASASVGKGSQPDVSNYVTSPKGVVDPESGVYVLQYRDGATGEVLNQYPSAKAVDAYKRGAENGTSAVPSTGPETPGVQTGSVQAGSVQAGTGSANEGGAVVVTPSPSPSSGSGGSTSTAGLGSVKAPSTSVDV